MKKEIYIVFLSLLALGVGSVYAAGNKKNDSFSYVKRELLNKVYYDHRETFYCGAAFNSRKKVKLPAGFTYPKYANLDRRLDYIEWEHIVPAENFGKTFPEWKYGSSKCIFSFNGATKGRKCADLASREYRLMQADMYNLYPSIGAVNALRQNYNFTEFSKNTRSSFGSCPVKVQGRAVEPPEKTRGAIARTYRYMAWAYPRYKLSAQQERLMKEWDAKHPVTSWECTRAKRIEKLQGNENPFVKEACQKNRLW